MKISKMKKVAKSRTIPAIDGHVLIENGWATATNLEIALRYRTEVKGEGIVPIAAIEDGFDHAEIKGENIHVSKAGVELTYPAYSKDKFPWYDDTDKELKPVLFKHVAQFKEAAKFAGSDAGRPAMGGVYFDENNIVATDAHKLRWYKYPNKSEKFIVPKEVAEIMLENEYRMSLIQNKHERTERIIFRGKDEEIISRLIDHKYPNWIAVLPEQEDLKLKLKVPTAALVNSLNVGLKTANGVTKAIVFHVKGSNLILFSFDTDLKKEFKSTIPLDREYGEIQFCYNGKFLLSVLNTKVKNTMIEIQSPNRAAIINGDTLLMPIMIDGDMTKVNPEIVMSNKNYEPTIGEDYPGVYTNPKPKPESPIKDEEINGAISEPETESPEPETPIQEHENNGAISEPEHQPEEEAENAEFVEEAEQAEAIQPKILQYSEKAIAVIGDTKRFRLKFKQIYGRWNPHIVINGTKGAWIFSKKRQQQVSEILGL